MTREWSQKFWTFELNKLNISITVIFTRGDKRTHSCSKISTFYFISTNISHCSLDKVLLSLPLLKIYPVSHKTKEIYDRSRYSDSVYRYGRGNYNKPLGTWTWFQTAIKSDEEDKGKQVTWGLGRAGIPLFDFCDTDLGWLGLRPWAQTTLLSEPMRINSPMNLLCVKLWVWVTTRVEGEQGSPIWMGRRDQVVCNISYRQPISLQTLFLIWWSIRLDVTHKSFCLKSNGGILCVVSVMINQLSVSQVIPFTLLIFSKTVDDQRSSATVEKWENTVRRLSFEWTTTYRSIPPHLSPSNAFSLIKYESVYLTFFFRFPF